MKKIFYYAAMALAVSAVMVSCEKKNAETPEVPKKVRLATPEVTATVNTEEGTVSVSWFQIEGAVSYTYKVDEGTETSTDKLKLDLSIDDLQAGNHTVSVKAIPAEDSEEYNESNWGSASFTLEQQEVEMPEEYAAYVGTWSMATTHVFNWVDNPENEGYVMPNYQAKESVFPVTIAWDGINEVLVITGISPLDAKFGTALPAVITKFEDGNLYICGMISLNLDLSSVASQLAGYQLTWLGVADVKGEYSILTSSGISNLYKIESNGDGLTGTGADVTVGMQDGSTYDSKFVAIDLIPMTNSGQMTILTSDTDYMPGGTFTFTKTGSAVPARASISVINSILTNNFVASMAFPIAMNEVNR